MQTPTYSFKEGPQDGFTMRTKETPFNWVLFSKPMHKPGKYINTHQFKTYTWTPEDMGALVGKPTEEFNITHRLDQDKLYAAYRLQWEPDERVVIQIGPWKGYATKGVYIFISYLMKPTS